MDARDPKLMWIEPLFDVSQPYLYIIVLPALTLFALGYRRLTFMFTAGALACIAVLKMV